MKKLFALLALVVGMTTTSFANTSSASLPAGSHTTAAPTAATKVMKVATKAEMVALANQLTAGTTAKVVAQDTTVIIIVFDDGTVIIIIITD
ncbi:MAG: hypothetical protein H7Z21_15580 [Hymenobacter sp.]|nr:hypothetical protein [Hymenobacter sp.]